MKLQSLPMLRLPSLIKLGKRLGLSTLLWFSLPGAMVRAQITPDGSLESAVQQIQELMKINGGERAGNNLFHSFEEFSVPAGMEAVFENATDIENIFTRVTGDSVSAIDGILSAQGEANLFLMNPNGIVFGTDASINVGGSFIATTADSIQFDNGEEFAASDAENDALINIGFPVAFGFNKEPEGSITVNGAGNGITPSFSSSETQVEENGNGIEVESGNTLGLIGNGITVDGGTINASGGNIELGSVGIGVVGVQPTENGFAFNYDNINSYKNVNLTDLSLVSASGVESEAISLTGANISAKKNSAISANAEGGDGGNITINTDTLSGIDNSDITANAVQGDGGNITITADAIIGFAERAELTPLSDITASSDFGTARVITELEVAAREVESENLAKDFAQSCSQGQGRFVYSALGEPQNPDRYFDDTHEYSAEEVSDVRPNYPPIGFPQTEQQKRDLERFRQNKLRRQQGKAPTIQQSKQEVQVQGQIVIAEIDPNTDKGYPIIYSETNTVPPKLNAWRKPGAPREEANAIQINPNGEHYMVRIAQIEHPSNQVCTTTSNSAANS